MIAACPKCQTRYRLRLEQLGERGVRLRCRRCEALFRVLPPPPEADSSAAPGPENSAPAPTPVASPPTQPSPAPAAPSPTQPSPAPAAPLPTEPAAPVLLVAHRDAREAKRIADLFAVESQSAVACDDGAQALLAIHRAPPQVAILDAGLAGVDGNQICEVLKRSPELNRIPVVLLRSASADAPDPEAAGFGADLYLDPDACSGSLEALLREPLAGWGLLVPAAPTPAEPPATDESPRALETPSATPDLVPAAGSAEPAAPAAGTPELGDELARAERLARIAVSDIILYNEEKFAAALRSGDPLQTMRDEVEEGRSLLRGRIESEVFAQRDFVGEELLRVARERA